MGRDSLFGLGGENTGSAVLNWIAVYSPAGFERYFLEIGTRTPTETPPRFTVEQMEALDRKYGIRYLR